MNIFLIILAVLVALFVAGVAVTELCYRRYTRSIDSKGGDS